MARSRAYRQPIAPDETAQRIARSIRDHAAMGVTRDITLYTTRKEVVIAVAAILAATQKGSTHA